MAGRFAAATRPLCAHPRRSHVKRQRRTVRRPLYILCKSLFMLTALWLCPRSCSALDSTPKLFRIVWQLRLWSRPQLLCCTDLYSVLYSVQTVLLCSQFASVRSPPQLPTNSVFSGFRRPPSGILCIDRSSLDALTVTRVFLTHASCCVSLLFVCKQPRVSGVASRERLATTTNKHDISRPSTSNTTIYSSDIRKRYL